MGFRREEIPPPPPPLTNNKTTTTTTTSSSNRRCFGYVCVKCGYRSNRMDISKITFHRCNKKLRKVKQNMNRYKDLYTKIAINKTQLSRENKLKGRICHNCKKIFPTKEMCFNHYSRKTCKKRKYTNNNKQHHYYKCNICGDYYEMYSILQRHMREHAYIKRIRKKMGLPGRYTGRLRGGGSPLRQTTNTSSSTTLPDDDTPGPSRRWGLRRRRHENNNSPPPDNDDDDDDDDDDNNNNDNNDDNVSQPIDHSSQNEPILPIRWGWTTHMLALNTPDFDGELISRLMLAEIKAEISERKRTVQNNKQHNDDDDNDDGNSSSSNLTDLENDEQFSTLSMIANLKVYFYKLDLEASLGKKNRLLR